MSRSTKFSLWKSHKAEDARGLAVRLSRFLCGKRIGWAFLLLAVTVQSGWVDRRSTYNAAKVTLLFALVPATEAFSPGVDRDYPPHTRLLSWQRSGSETIIAELAPGWIPVSPPTVSYDGERVLFAGKRQKSDSAQIWQIDSQGSSPRQITHFRADCASPQYLPGGRIVFSGLVEEEAFEEGVNLYSLFTCAPDGSQLERITFGRSQDHAAAVLQDGRILFERFLPAAPDESPSQQWMTVNPDGTAVARYVSSLPSKGPILPSGGQIMSWQAKEQEEYALYEVDPLSGDKKLLFKQEGFHAVDPVVASPRPLPSIATSVVDRTRSRGWLLCLDAYLSDAGRFSGVLEKVRVLDAQTEAVIGEAPIEENGSFFLEVPADRLLLLETLDETGQLISRLQSGIWIRPNEHRACIGCHESHYLAPENRVPSAVEKPPIAVGLTRSGAEPANGVKVESYEQSKQ